MLHCLRYICLPQYLFPGPVSWPGRDQPVTLTLIIICLFVGVLIGAVGIGGVLLVPALALVAGIGVHQAIPACMLSYLATGAVGTLIYARHGSIQWKTVFWVCTGAVPAAFLGSMSLLSIPASAVMLLIALLMVFAGIDTLRKSLRSDQGQHQSRSLGRAHFFFIGLATGFGSAITGTGGPLILVPLTIYLGLPVLTAVGLSQAIQIPIASFASIGNWMAGNLDIELGLLIAVSMVTGSMVGATLMHRLPTGPIRKGMAVILIVVGCGLGLRLLFTLELI